MGLTFLLIKPDAVSNGYVDDIVKFVEDVGFEVLARKQKTLSRADGKDKCLLDYIKKYNLKVTLN